MSTSSSPSPSRLHPLPKGKDIPPPQYFTYPFCYQPHPLCKLAADELKAEIERHADWKAEISQGKMLGVLVVEGGFLAAFSGTLCGLGTLPYFVPPVFDLHTPNCHFQIEENEISLINQKIKELEEAPKLTALKQSVSDMLEQNRKELESFRLQMVDAKKRRDKLRAEGKNNEELIRESQFQKAQLRRIRHRQAADLEEKRKEIAQQEAEITQLKEERAKRSSSLQHWLFHSFSFLNAQGEQRLLPELFQDGTPPAGAGECCAPKLLQYAYVHHLRPLCMAEFWLGNSPKDELRKEGNYYPACQAKCKPILSWMLKGLNVEPNPLTEHYNQIVSQLKILYHDCDIAIVSKPAGMLSVPGKDGLPSIKTEAKRLFPYATGPIVVHRLDMDTSGLMVLALNTESYLHLQKQFVQHSIVKRYVAEVERPLPQGSKGTIKLPLAANPFDRPRQTVNYTHGKQAITHYEVIGDRMLNLWPETGRTHQLRLHLAHPDGLDNPIIGDRLYGHPSDRLHLHADFLQFTHPRSGEKKTFVDEIMLF